MAQCTNQTLSAIQRPCGGGKGGIKTEVYIALRDNLGDVTFVEQDPNPKNTISAITLNNAAKWYKFEFNRNAADFTSTAQYDGQTGEFSYFENALNLAFRKMDASVRLSIQALLENEVIVAFSDNNGVKYLLGYEEYVTSTSCTHTTGTNKTDSNVISITLTDTTSQLPYQLTDACWTSIEETAAVTE